MECGAISSHRGPRGGVSWGDTGFVDSVGPPQTQQVAGNANLPLRILIRKRHTLWPPQSHRPQCHSFSFPPMPAGKNQENPPLLSLTSIICINLHKPVPRPPAVGTSSVHTTCNQPVSSASFMPLLPSTVPSAQGRGAVFREVGWLELEVFWCEMHFWKKIKRAQLWSLITFIHFILWGTWNSSSISNYGKRFQTMPHFKLLMR